VFGVDWWSGTTGSVSEGVLRKEAERRTMEGSAIPVKHTHTHTHT